MPNIIDKKILSGFSIMDDAEIELLDRVKTVGDLLFEEIVKLFENIEISNGKLSTSPKAEQFLMSLDKRIAAAMEKSGYNKGVAKFVPNFDKITQNVIDIQDKLNKINIKEKDLTPFQRVAVSDTIEALAGGGVSKSFVAPIRQALYRNIMLGATVGETEALIRAYTISKEGQDSILLRYVKQVARDSMGQYKGFIQTNISNELSLNAMRYVGSIIVDSRAQCAKWVNDGVIKLDSSFENEITKALNGTLFYDVAGKNKKSSGMILGTTLSNFLVNRGGWNCRHDGIPTRIFNK